MHCFRGGERLGEPLDEKRRKKLRTAVSGGLTLAFVALVVLVLTYSLPIIVRWPSILAIIYLLTLYAILYPLALPLVPPKMAYYGYIPAPFFGLEVSIIFWLSRYGMLNPYILLGSVLTVSLTLILAHYLTRQGFAIHRKFLYGGLGLDLKIMTRVAEVLIAPFFLVMSTSFSNAELMNLPSASVLIVVSSLIGLYLTFSVLGLNVCYRKRELNRKLGTRDFASKIGHLETDLFKKYPQKSETVEFLSFVLRSAVDDFIYGDYERSFLDSYRIIHDKIIEDPKMIAEKMLEEKTLEEYRQIRVFLVHGILQDKKTKLEIPIQVKDVVWARKVLFHKTLDSIESAFKIADKI